MCLLVSSSAPSAFSSAPIRERGRASSQVCCYTLLASSSRALRYFYLPHPVLRRAPRAGTVGLRNPAASSPVREKGDKVFGERYQRDYWLRHGLPLR